MAEPDSIMSALEAGQPVQVFGGAEFAEAARGFSLHFVLLALASLSIFAWLVLAVPSVRSFLRG